MATDTRMEHFSQAELMSWCNVVTQDYTGINMDEEDGEYWRSGLGFCAIIARFRPDLIQFDSLGKIYNVFESKNETIK